MKTPVDMKIFILIASILSAIYFTLIAMFVRSFKGRDAFDNYYQEVMKRPPMTFDEGLFEIIKWNLVGAIILYFGVTMLIELLNNLIILI